MKKSYLIGSTFLLAGMYFAQAPYMRNNFTYAPDEKHAPFAISTIDGRSIEMAHDRAVYYTQDFDGGFDGWSAVIQEGPVNFKLTNSGHENDPENTFQIPVMATSTPTQWVLLDSDGDNSSYGIPEAATLTSPMLDLSAASGEFVALTFDQFFAEWQPDETAEHCYIGVSTDGIAWTEIEINEGVGREARPNPEKISWDITDLIAGEEATVWVRFRWDGAWNYGWQIDNVQIEDINESDLAILTAYRNYDGGIVYSQVPQAHAQEFIIGAVIKNIGHIEQTNIKFNYVISGPDGTEVASGISTAFIPSLVNGQQDTLLHETGYTPDELGNYTIEWTAISDDADDATIDNTLEDAFFELTEYTMALDYDLGPISEISNWPLKTGEAYFGNLMSFQVNDEATALIVQITDYTENLGEVIKGAVWEFVEEGTEWSLVFDSNEHDVTEDDLGGFVTFDLEEFEVNPTSLYLFCAYQYASTPQPMFVRQGDIGFNNLQGKDDEYLNRGFFDRAAPIVRVRLNPGEVGLTETVQKNVLAVYPNPATEQINVTLSTNSESSSQVNLVDLSGKIIQTLQVGQSNETSIVQFNIANLQAGVYFIELINEKGKEIEKVVKK